MLFISTFLQAGEKHNEFTLDKVAALYISFSDCCRPALGGEWSVRAKRWICEH